MRRTKEGGSVLGFVVVAIVLGTLLLGGVYLVSRQEGRSASPVTKPQEPSKKDEKQAPPPAEPGKKPELQAPQSTPQAGVAHELPVTGPTESLGPLLVLGLVSGLFVSYIRSRQAHLSL